MDDNQDNFDQNTNEQIDKGGSIKNNFRVFLYELFNYRSYHSYRKNLSRLEILFVIGMISCFIPSQLGNILVTLNFYQQYRLVMLFICY